MPFFAPRMQVAQDIGFRVKGGVKLDQWGGVKVDQLSMWKIGDCRGGGRLERRPAPPARRRV